MFLACLEWQQNSGEVPWDIGKLVKNYWPREMGSHIINVPLSRKSRVVLTGFIRTKVLVLVGRSSILLILITRSFSIKLLRCKQFFWDFRRTFARFYPNVPVTISRISQTRRFLYLQDEHSYKRTDMMKRIMLQTRRNKLCRVPVARMHY